MAALLLLILLAVATARAAVTYQVLKSFSYAAGDGAAPYCGVIEASDGALYGTTDSDGTYNQGTVFTLNKDGSGYRILHSFNPNAGEGYDPFGALVEGSDGALYGTTQQGGTDSHTSTVFKLKKDGTSYTVLHRFTPTDPG